MSVRKCEIPFYYGSDSSKAKSYRHSVLVQVPQDFIKFTRLAPPGRLFICYFTIALVIILSTTVAKQLQCKFQRFTNLQGTTHLALELYL